MGLFFLSQGSQNHRNTVFQSVISPLKAAHPRWPATTRYIFQGACQAGRGHLLGRRRASCALGTYSFCPPAAVGTSARAPACSTSTPAVAAAVRAALQAKIPPVCGYIINARPHQLPAGHLFYMPICHLGRHRARVQHQYARRRRQTLA